jgi:hypothetical protein
VTRAVVGLAGFDHSHMARMLASAADVVRMRSLVDIHIALGRLDASDTAGYFNPIRFRAMLHSIHTFDQQMADARGPIYGFGYLEIIRPPHRLHRPLCTQRGRSRTLACTWWRPPLATVASAST